MLDTRPKRSKRKKPKKPYKHFPLYAHATGRWAKKIRGQLFYFGPWSDPDAALALYMENRVSLHAGLGMNPLPSAEECLKVRELCNHFLTSKKHLLDNDELSPRTFRDYVSTCDRMLKTSAFRYNPAVQDLVSGDFAKLRTAFAKNLGPINLGNEIQRVRSLFKYGYDSGLIDNPIRFGPGFKKPTRKVIRQARQANGPRMFEAEELRAAITEASHPLKAIILLAANCGFGQGDIGN